MLSTAQATASLDDGGPALIGPIATVLLALPLVGLGLLLVRPELNIEWHHHQATSGSSSPRRRSVSPSPP